MKLSDDEKQTGVAGLDIAMAHTKSVVTRWRFQNLRTKLERSLRDGRAESSKSAEQSGKMNAIH